MVLFMLNKVQHPHIEKTMEALKAKISTDMGVSITLKSAEII